MDLGNEFLFFSFFIFLKRRNTANQTCEAIRTSFLRVLVEDLDRALPIQFWIHGVGIAAWTQSYYPIRRTRDSRSYLRAVLSSRRRVEPLLQPQSPVKRLSAWRLLRPDDGLVPWPHWLSTIVRTPPLGVYSSCARQVAECCKLRLAYNCSKAHCFRYILGSPIGSPERALLRIFSGWRVVFFFISSICHWCWPVVRGATNVWSSSRFSFSIADFVYFAGASRPAPLGSPGI